MVRSVVTASRLPAAGCFPRCELLGSLTSRSSHHASLCLAVCCGRGFCSEKRTAGFWCVGEVLEAIKKYNCPLNLIPWYLKFNAGALFVYKSAHAKSDFRDFFFFKQLPFSCLWEWFYHVELNVPEEASEVTSELIFMLALYLTITTVH